MKNTFAIITICAILLIAGLGCGFTDRVQKSADGTENANTSTTNKTLTDKAVDTAMGEERIGVPECDEVMDMLTAEANNPDDGYIVKAAKAVFFNRIRESIKRSVEENKGDTTELVKTCRDAKKQLDKYKAEEEAKQNR